MFLEVVREVLEQGLLWAPMVLGIYVTFRILNYADLTVDGSFTLGAAIAAQLIFVGVNPWLGIGVGVFAGGLAGAVTGLLHTQLKIPALLSGILTMIGLYSINLRIMGRANFPSCAWTPFSRTWANGSPHSWRPSSWPSPRWPWWSSFCTLSCRPNWASPLGPPVTT